MYATNRAAKCALLSVIYLTYQPIAYFSVHPTFLDIDGRSDTNAKVSFRNSSSVRWSSCNATNSAYTYCCMVWNPKKQRDSGFWSSFWNCRAMPGLWIASDRYKIDKISVIWDFAFPSIYVEPHQLTDILKSSTSSFSSISSAVQNLLSRFL